MNSRQPDADVLKLFCRRNWISQPTRLETELNEQKEREKT